ncbi:hypothetical protein SAMN05192562_102192 [Kosakonia arachidis]|uniref:Uncharacterized protein n=1 Tax=Kosakonia arachidis TaxID=551989 RepID=A0A1I7B078_9ENTR|nr:hypothetical protein [Kosakonia arachidis]SFT80548.1 hypothetical protein SAMN05192562_102192 [Kosakonia arachidis]
MSVNSIGSNLANTHYQVDSAREKSESKSLPDNDRDSDDAVKSVSKMSTPSVNSSGSVVGSVVNVKV